MAASPSEAQQLAAIANELLERLQLRIELRRVERIDLVELRQPATSEVNYFARVWVTLPPPGPARLYLEHSSRDRILIRDVIEDSHNPELTREALGQILQAALEGLIAGETLGAPRAEVLAQLEVAPPTEKPALATPKSAVLPTPPPVPQKRAAPSRPAPEAEATSVLRVGVRYELAWLGRGVFHDGPGLVFGLTLPTQALTINAPRLGLELIGLWRRPLRVDDDPVGVRLQTWMPTALLTLDLWNDASSVWRIGAGVTSNWTRVSATTLGDSDLELAPGDWLHVVEGRVAVSYAYRAMDGAHCELTAGATLDASETRYVVQEPSAARVVFAPAPVRPFVSFGIGVP